MDRERGMDGSNVVAVVVWRRFNSGRRKRKGKTRVVRKTYLV